MYPEKSARKSVVLSPIARKTKLCRKQMHVANPSQKEGQKQQTEEKIKIQFYIAAYDAPFLTLFFFRSPVLVETSSQSGKMA